MKRPRFAAATAAIQPGETRLTGSASGPPAGAAADVTSISSSACHHSSACPQRTTSAVNAEVEPRWLATPGSRVGRPGQVALQFHVGELVASPVLAEHVTYFMGIFKESHERPRQLALQTEPDAGYQEARRRRMVGPERETHDQARRYSDRQAIGDHMGERQFRVDLDHRGQAVAAESESPGRQPCRHGRAPERPGIPGQGSARGGRDGRPCRLDAAQPDRPGADDAERHTKQQADRRALLEAGDDRGRGAYDDSAGDTELVLPAAARGWRIATDKSDDDHDHQCDAQSVHDRGGPAGLDSFQDPGCETADQAARYPATERRARTGGQSDA